MIRLFLLFCWTSGYWLSSFAQTSFANPQIIVENKFYRNLIFENFGLEDGLPNRATWYTIKDRQGFIWLSTEGGLVRYDGLNFKAYKNIPFDTTSLSLNRLWQILEDSAGFLWVATHGGGLNRFDPKTETFSIYPLEPRDSNIMSSNVIWHLIEDSQNRIWVTTRGQGLYIIDTNTNTTTHYSHDPYDPESLSSNIITEPYEDSQGRFWVPTIDQGLNLFDPNTGKALRFLSQSNRASRIAGNTIIQLKEDRENKLWIATWSGLSVLDMRDTSFTNYTKQTTNPNSLSNNRVYGVLEDSKNRIWAATHIGLNLYHADSGQFIPFFWDPINPHSLVHNLVRRIYEDRDSIIWITTANGISKLTPYNNHFTFISLVNSSQEKKSNSFDIEFSDIMEDSGGNIWMATRFNGLYVYEPKTDTYRHFLLYSDATILNLPITSIWQLEEGRNGRIWIGTSNGLFFYDPDQKKIQDFGDEISTTRQQSQLVLDNFKIDQKGNIWIGNSSGLFKINPQTKKIISHYPYQADSPNGLLIGLVMAIEEDPYGNLWLGGEGGGLQCFDPEKETFTRLQLPVDLPTNFATNHSSKYMIDSRGFIWINGNTSLLRFKPDSLGNPTQFSQWKAVEGKIHEDKAGRYWLVEKDGISLFDPLKGKQRTFSLMGITESLDGSFESTQSGGIYLGGFRGLYHFYPDQISRNTKPPSVVLTDFKLFNNSVPIMGTYGDTMKWPSPLEQSIRFTKNITLQHHLNDFTIEFVALDFIQPKRNQYKYLLEGYNEDTLSTTAERPFATYTNLSPGSYTFRVWGSNNDGVWNKESAFLNLTILPPWYWSGWSKSLYFLIIISILYAFYHFQLARKLEQAETERLKALDLVKTRLYTNITHEFRTPLTVISGMADQVLNNPKTWFREGLAMIKRNSQQLLSLVNQMLDLSKLESGSLPVHMIQDDIIGYLKYLTESFHSYAETKDIRLHLLPEVEELQMDFDPEKMLCIFSNLVNNAIKFTPAGGDVYVSVDSRQLMVDSKLGSRSGNTVTMNEGASSLMLKIKDTGEGIAEEYLPHIFDRFYQSDDSATRKGEGTGIGLALTRELVKLLDGKIEVKSQLGKGTEFTLWLPVKREAAKDKAISPATEGLPVSASDLQPGFQAAEAPARENEQPLALLIEDNKDVLQYLASCLQDQYRLEMSLNGREGIEKAIELVPDIVISDVMMPEKDGFEVVATLKNDERTSHIPIVLLTAKADMASRIEGLEYGADAYLAKPFNQKELEVRLRKLIELRQNLQARYYTLSPPASVQDKALKKEDAFLLKVREAVEENLGDNNFGISKLCRVVAISRAQLHRKLKALTNRSTSHVIRLIRLQKAKQLLETTDLNISEVGYAVGFVNRSHFTHAFTQEFGHPPSYYKKNK